MPVRFELLTQSHPVAAFACTNRDMTAYLHKHAFTNQQLGLGNTYVAIDQKTSDITGYFSLATASMQVAELPPDLVRGLPGFPLPCLLLTRLARSASLQSKGVGSMLLIEAMRVALTIDKAVGYRYVVADAIDAGASSFYTKFGFFALPVPDDNVFPRRMVLNFKVVRTTISQLDRRARADASRTTNQPTLAEKK